MSFEEEVYIKITCENCGEVSEIDGDKSNSNWEVHEMECRKCGGRCNITIE